MIRVTLDSAAVGPASAAESRERAAKNPGSREIGRRSNDEDALPPVSASYGAGVPTLLATEGGNRPTVLSLVASGRMKLDAGSVTAVDDTGHALTPAQLRRAVALIDTPLVAEHSDDVSVATVVREELAYVNGHARRSWAAKHAAAHPAAHPAARAFGSLSAHDRLELLIDLALLRPDVAALVVTSPERHGGEPAAWWRLLRETAAGGIAVLIVTDHATVAHLTALTPVEPIAADPSAIPLFELTEIRAR